MDYLGALIRSPDYRIVEGATVFVRRGELQKDQTFVLRNLSNVRGLAEPPGSAEVYFLPILQHLFGPAHLPRNHVLQINHRGLATWNTPDAVSKLLPSPVYGHGIPAKLHTIYGMWDTTGRPDLSVWEELNPEYQVRVWTPETCQALLRAHFVDWIDWFEAATPIDRVDAMRWLILYHEGGVCVDQDTTPIQSLVQVLEAAHQPRVLLVSDENSHLATHCVGLSQRHPFAHFMMNHIRTATILGSLALTEIYESYGKDFADLSVLPADRWLLHKFERSWDQTKTQRTEKDVVSSDNI